MFVKLTQVVEEEEEKKGKERRSYTEKYIYKKSITLHYFFICSSGGLCQETSRRKMKRKCLRFVAFSFFSRPNNSIVLYRVYQGYRPNIGKRNEMIIFGSFLTTLNVSNNFGVASLSSKIG